MNWTRHALMIGLGLCIATPALAQQGNSLEQENARLRAELQALQQRQGGTTSAPVTVQGAALEGSIASLRLGQATGYTKGTVALTVMLALRNTGNVPLTLNYEQNSFAATDNHGYQYRLYHEHLSDKAYAQDIKGIPMATRSRAGTSQILAPGQSLNVTFIATRYMRDGQTPGSHFDIQATFGQYQDEGQGRIRKLRDFPVAFTNQTPGAGQPGSSPAARGSRLLERAADQLLDRVIK